jgi:hypothetical protein
LAQVALWQKRIRDSSQSAFNDPVACSLDAYAIRQQRIWSRRIDLFIDAWAPALDGANIGQDWLTTYRARHACFLASKTRKKLREAGSLAVTDALVEAHPATTAAGDVVDDVLSYAEEGVWEQERVDTWVPAEEADDDEDTEHGSSTEGEGEDDE